MYSVGESEFLWVSPFGCQTPFMDKKEEKSVWCGQNYINKGTLFCFDYDAKLKSVPFSLLLASKRLASA